MQRQMSTNDRGVPGGAAETGQSPSGSFESFFRDHYPQLLGGMFLACGDAHEAEELAQEAMARAFERWDKVRLANHPLGYVHQIGFNLLRRRHRLRVFRGGLISAETVDPEELATDKAFIAAAVSRLPLAQRQTLLLMEWLDLPEKEVASLLGVRPVTVRTRAHKARTALRSQLGGSSDEGY